MFTSLHFVRGRIRCVNPFSESWRRAFSFRSLLLITLCVLGSSPGFGQNSKDFTPSYYVGAGGGTSFGAVYFFPTVNQDIHMGYIGGLVFGVDVEPYAGMRMEINYNRRGWVERFEAERKLNYSKSLEYIEVPLMSHFYYRAGSVGFFLNVGPQIGLRIGEHTERSGSGFTEQELRRIDQALGDKFMWGLAGGPGFFVRLGKLGQLELDARAFFNFSTVYPIGRSEPYGRANEFGGYVKLNYFYRF